MCVVPGVIDARSVGYLGRKPDGQATRRTERELRPPRARDATGCSRVYCCCCCCTHVCMCVCVCVSTCVNETFLPSQGFPRKFINQHTQTATRIEKPNYTWGIPLILVLFRVGLTKEKDISHSNWFSHPLSQVDRVVCKSRRG